MDRVVTFPFAYLRSQTRGGRDGYRRFLVDGDHTMVLLRSVACEDAPVRRRVRAFGKTHALRQYEGAAWRRVLDPRGQDCSLEDIRGAGIEALVHVEHGEEQRGDWTEHPGFLDRTLMTAENPWKHAALRQVGRTPFWSADFDDRESRRKRLERIAGLSLLVIDGALWTKTSEPGLRVHVRRDRVSVVPWVPGLFPRDENPLDTRTVYFDADENEKAEELVSSLGSGTGLVARVEQRLAVSGNAVPGGRFADLQMLKSFLQAVASSPFPLPAHGASLAELYWAATKAHVELDAVAADALADRICSLDAEQLDIRLATVVRSFRWRRFGTARGRRRGWLPLALT